MKDMKLVAAVAVAVLVVIFAIQNSATVRVEFLVWNWTASRALVLFLVFLAGIAVGWLGRGARRRSRVI